MNYDYYTYNVNYNMHNNVICIIMSQTVLIIQNGFFSL